MPIHDWSRVDANLFHDFHQSWTVGIRNSLNGGLLPKGYSALVEQHAGGVVPDVIASERRASAQPPTGGAVITANPPQTRSVYRADRELVAGRANRVVIRHPLGRVISVIELIVDRSVREQERRFLAARDSPARHRPFPALAARSKRHSPADLERVSGRAVRAAQGTALDAGCLSGRFSQDRLHRVGRGWRFVACHARLSG